MTAKLLSGFLTFLPYIISAKHEGFGVVKFFKYMQEWD
jgi:hypothetical protein